MHKVKAAAEGVNPQMTGKESSGKKEKHRGPVRGTASQEENVKAEGSAVKPKQSLSLLKRVRESCLPYAHDG